jgi:hypothetical protein
MYLLAVQQDMYAMCNRVDSNLNSQVQLLLRSALHLAAAHAAQHATQRNSSSTQPLLQLS